MEKDTAKPARESKNLLIGCGGLLRVGGASWPCIDRRELYQTDSSAVFPELTAPNSTQLPTLSNGNMAQQPDRSATKTMGQSLTQCEVKDLINETRKPLNF